MANNIIGLNPTANNPAVTLQNGVLARGDGIAGSFYVDLLSAFPQAAITTAITGAPAACTVALQGSMDGAAWTTLATSTSTTGDTQFSGPGFQFSALRVNVSGVSGGTAPTISVGVSAFSSPGGSASAAAATSVKITDGTNTAGVGAASGGSAAGNSVLVSSGLPTAGLSLNAVSAANTLGTTIDFGSGKRCINAIFWSASTTTAGSVGVQYSYDGVHWIASTVTLTFTNLDNGSGIGTPNSISSAQISNATGSFRYARAFTVVAMTGGAVSCQIGGS